MSLLLTVVLSLHAAPELASAESARFRILTDYPDTELGRRVAAEALAVADSIWEPLSQWVRTPETLEAPLEIHLFRDAAGYEAAEAELTHGRFKSNLSFSSHVTRSSYIATQPPVTDDALEALGLPFQTRRLIAHEAAHIATYASYPHNFADHPDWFAEGLASLVEARATSATLGKRPWPSEPYFANAAVRVQQDLAAGKLPSCALLLRDELGKGYAHAMGVRWLFFEFLASGKNARRLRTIADGLRRKGGGQPLVEPLFAVVERAFGKRAFKGLDAAFAEFVRAQKPEWKTVNRAMGFLPDGSLSAVAFPSRNTIAWRLSAPKKTSYALEGTLEVVAGAQLNLLLDHTDEGFVSLAFVAGETPGITLFDYAAKTNHWERVDFVRLDDFPVGSPRDFRVVVKRGHLSVHFAGADVFDLEIEGRDLRGPWGLGAQAGSAGIWRLAALPGE